MRQPLRLVVLSLALALSACAHHAAAPTGGAAAASEPSVQIGRCVGFAGLAETKKAGFDYAELPLREVAKLTDEEFAARLAEAKALGLPTPTANSAFPGELKVVGPDVKMDEVMAYVAKAFDRAEKLGITIVVFGSGPSRKVPDGFSRDEAWKQLVEFGKRIAPEAQRHGIVVAVEPLQKKETNIINTAGEGLKWVEEVNHPNFQLMVDFYHLSLEHEDPAILVSAKDHIKHFHFANPNGRVFPLSAQEFDYAPFFANLRKMGFHGHLSVEAKPANGIEQDGPRAIAFLRSEVAPAPAATASR